MNQFSGEKLALTDKRKKLETTSEAAKRLDLTSLTRTVCSDQQTKIASFTSEAMKKLGLTNFRENVLL